MFDLDGTLVDSVPDLAVAVDQMLEGLGYSSVGARRTRLWIGNGIALLVKRALLHVGLSEEQVMDDAEEYLRAKALFDKAYHQCCGQYSVVYDGVYECLNVLADAKVAMAVITNKSTAFTGELLAEMGLDKYFSTVVCGDTLSKRKPDPAPLLYAMKQNGVESSGALMVGDSRHDLAAARAAHVLCVAVPYGYNHGEPIADFGPDALVSTLDDLVCVEPPAEG